ncbi:MAG: secondary thiamine-phosphate synthase enzyme YjbQ [Candidatus Marinimicrobia bacterium]|jgi:secondary thiamine-phosphate synthase enzyme|nr:secondary thiamine-phosphate synthase enzyme YjbQ [Candidatus Neomarinimicrobiota bacterium]MDP6593437.1 secondary thiamine-phosphate synthase enzyme YjbQ [Candidatus Neomarinimicrobiota bacterium]MDP6836530.1 secondary thiamine-phosphate synthase enzyme YjbQ [Candidatus Neomarinimicrobiota bacterium]MDP6965806.1 secondary thiamine-phosphate synthase enzyme YjbQ [Candidatus Neomarinimicrobiota bacterium]|tara:strand:+ start:500 stop:895 length:396 start_codon:yes stop_codon:yes gene_type:complete
MITLSVATHQRIDFVDITSQVREEVNKSRVEDGMVVIYVPHTTCGVTINESADPDVAEDIKMQLTKLVPHKGGYHHLEGNADSHIKTSMIGSSETVFIENGKLVLGTWQGIFLCDFDGPRTRKVYIKIVEG